ncbi:MAG: MMPL family transporter [Actinobacteria bacterium]|uniref:Unannotated protein n=1 Tax=freshwater metagenome TaxID=449393 RepID=A0A6J7FG51_9ZZZZ|nr:MMPL family transporter [Actinomycetota bacterium]MTB28030.1 MMPL family transporter [Actinomycetota bacterium]
MPGLSTWAVRRPVVALIAWFVALVAVIGLGVGVGGNLNDSFSLPDTESTTAQDLLVKGAGGGGSFSAGGKIVWSPATGVASDPASLAVIKPLIDQLAQNKSISCISSILGNQGSACPPQQSAPTPDQLAQMTPEQKAALQALTLASAPISKDGKVAYANITFAGDGTSIDSKDAKIIVAAITEANTDTVTVAYNGQILEYAGQEPPSSEGIGLIVAIIILLIAFGSLVAAGLPIVAAIMGLAMGQMGVLVTANFLDVATFAPTLAAMIGLGVGIDYSLFVINRYRQALLAGHDPKAAAMESVHTAGRAVLFAGSTVVIALLGLFVMRINFFNGLAVASSVTVLFVMLSALWFLPALLSLLGTKALAIRLPWGKKPGEVHPEGKAWAHYGRMIQRKPIIPALVSLGVVLVLAIPLFSLRLGFADDSGKAQGSPLRTAYDLMATGFGPGVNGPFFVAVELPKPNDVAAYATAVKALEATPGVASTLPSSAALPIFAANPAAFGKDGTIGTIMVTPTSAPQDEATTELLNNLRDNVNPQIAQETGAKLYVGGQQAIVTDFTSVLTDALPIFLLVVVGLGFLALVLLFHSIVVPLTAAITSLLSFAAATGITVAVFQWGWFANLIGLSGTGPIFPFLPIMVFAILFGLSMDYQVFLVSRMQEEWIHTGDNAASVRRGLAGSGRVVVIAAAIMASVFLAFVPDKNSMIKLFGVSLASAVIIDAFIIRLIFVPSIMSILGKANWWLPSWLDRILPRVQIEPGEDEITDDEAVVPSRV